MKASVLCSMTSEHKPLKEHLDLNSGRLRSYAHIREDITAYLEGKADSAAAQLRQGPAPMDVGAVGQGGKGASSSWQAPPRGGGKGTGPLDACFLCGGTHYARDCPSGDNPAPTRAPPAKGKGNKGKGNKGKDTGKHKEGRETHHVELEGSGPQPGTVLGGCH